MKKLSRAQVRFLACCSDLFNSGYPRPCGRGRETGRLARAWDRTAESLERLGLVVISRGVGPGAGAVAVLTTHWNEQWR